VEAARKGGTDTRRRLEIIPEPSPQPQQHAKLWVESVGCHVSLLSGATPQQLALLSAAFQLCPQPTSEQINALSCHVSIATEELDMWFQSRRVRTCWINIMRTCAHAQPTRLPARTVSPVSRAVSTVLSQTLQEWVLQPGTPQQQPATVAKLFYAEASEPEDVQREAGMAAPWGYD